MRLGERLHRRLSLAREVSTGLARRPIDRARLLTATGLSPLKRSVPVLRHRPLGVRIEYDGERLPWSVNDATGFSALREVLLEEQYRIDLAAEAPRTIVDLGSHVGASVLYFSRRYPGARIVAVEADPSTFERLRDNVGALPGVELVHAAVWSSAGTLAFHSNKHSWASSIAERSGSARGVDVPAVTLDGLLDDRGIERVDLLKIDIEGAELEALRCFEGLDRRVGALIGEFHDFYPDVAAGAEEFFGLLAGFEVEHRRDGTDHVFVASREPAGA